MTTGAFSQNVGKLFSELKLVTDNLLPIYAAANREATENIQHTTVIHPFTCKYKSSCSQHYTVQHTEHIEWLYVFISVQ